MSLEYAKIGSGSKNRHVNSRELWQSLFRLRRYANHFALFLVQYQYKIDDVFVVFQADTD